MIDLQLIANHIEDPELRTLTLRLLASAPTEFYTAPASSSGKYHPQFDLGTGGLARHTAVVAVLGVDALRRYYPRNAEPPRHLVDTMLAAGLLHDRCKNGYPRWGRHTQAEHPQIAAQYIADEASGSVGKPSPLVSAVCHAVRWHYGTWTAGEGHSPLFFANGESTTTVDDVDALCLAEADYFGSRRCWAALDEDILMQMIGAYARPVDAGPSDLDLP